MSITAAREELAALLNAGGLRAFDAQPERVVPPYVVVYAGEPWLVHTADSFEPFLYEARFLIRVFAPAGSLNKVHDTLDVMVKDAVVALGDEWIVEAVAQPVNANGILATELTVSKNINLIGGN